MVMKKALLKDSLREIRKTFSRFLAILAIVAISIAFFTGIKITCPDMKNTADKYYDDYQLMDFRLVSTVGFNNEDIQNIRELKEIKGVSPSYTIDAIMDAKDTNSVVRIHSLVQKEFRSGEDYTNRPMLISGRLPEKSGECVIEKSSFFAMNLDIGSPIKLTSGKEGEKLDTLKTDSFTVVGIIKSPLYVSKERGTSNIGTGKISSYIMINESDFNMPVYNTVYLTAKGADVLKAYSDDYDNQIKSLKSELDKLAITRAQTRFEEIKADANKVLSENAIAKVQWHILDRNTNTGYVDYGSAADRMNSIAQVFPLIFILVAILICFTAMGRMVDEQRAYIGTVKALGYTKTSIGGKYLLYAALASIIGGIIGVVIGFSFFPSFIFNAFTALYTMPKLVLSFDVPFAILSIGVGIAVTASSALIVCFEELHNNAAALMRPKAPKPGKIILLERIPFIWKRLKFTHKVTARNLLRYKSRFFMTVVGVAGCTALLLVGFGLKDSIGDIGTRQFGDIYTYQMTVNIKDNIKVDELASINKTIESSINFEDKQLYMSKSINIGYKNAEKDCGLVIPKNKDELPKFISLRERVSKKTVVLNDDGVILTEKLAQKIGASVGDEIFIKINDYENRTVKVTGICENYLNHFMYMSTKLYKTVFKTEPVYNDIYVKLHNIKNNDEDILSKNIISQNGVSAVYSSNEMLSRFKDTIKSINSVVLILIFSAGLLSFIVLYTLTNINIGERMREIATIKVLGFYDKEVSAYVFRENIILTLIGSGLGLILGYYLSMFVIQTAEVDVVMFGREIHSFSFALAALMTIVFALFVNFVMLKKIRNINMVEALKTVE
jgi:putative ABC transport system permease protein